MIQILNMFWVVVVFWLLIEVINSRMGRTRKEPETDSRTHQTENNR